MLAKEVETSHRTLGGGKDGGSRMMLDLERWEAILKSSGWNGLRTKGWGGWIEWTRPITYKKREVSSTRETARTLGEIGKLDVRRCTTSVAHPCHQ